MGSFLVAPSLKQFYGLTIVVGAMLPLIAGSIPMVGGAIAGITGLGWFFYLLMPSLTLMVFLQFLPWLFCGKGFFGGYGKPGVEKIGNLMFGNEDAWFLGNKDATVTVSRLLGYLCAGPLTFLKEIRDRLFKFWKTMVKDPVGVLGISILRAFRGLINFISIMIGGLADLCNAEPIKPFSAIIEHVAHPVLQGVKGLIGGIGGICNINIKMNDIIIEKGQLLETTIDFGVSKENIQLPGDEIVIPLGDAFELDFGKLLGSACDEIKSVQDKLKYSMKIREIKVAYGKVKKLLSLLEKVS